MQIEDMTVEQIEQYLQERKTRKGELGGVMKPVGNVKEGEIVWIKAEKLAQGDTISSFRCLNTHKIDDIINPYTNTLVETNVPERAPARRRMTVAEAAEQIKSEALKPGQTAWVKCSILSLDKSDGEQPICIMSDWESFYPPVASEIEVEA